MIETIKAKSYEGEEQHRVVRVSPEAGVIDVRGRHVLVVEDIVDTGGTLRTLVDRFAAAGAASVRGGAAGQARRPRLLRGGEQPKMERVRDAREQIRIGYGLDFDGAASRVEHVAACSNRRATRDYGYFYYRAIE